MCLIKSYINWYTFLLSGKLQNFMDKIKILIKSLCEVISQKTISEIDLQYLHILSPGFSTT